jgi:hypothetical protein
MVQGIEDKRNGRSRFYMEKEKEIRRTNAELLL